MSIENFNEKQEKKPRGRRTSMQVNGRNALLNSAIECFANMGFDNADTRTIASRANVSANLIRVHFGSKSELWDACLDTLVSQSKPILIEIQNIYSFKELTVYERLYRAFSILGDYFLTQPHVHNFVVRHISENEKRSKLIAEKLLLPTYESILPLIVDGIKCGNLKSKHPVVFFSLLNNAFNQPASFDSLVEIIAPDADPITIRKELNKSIITSLIHP
ncbi:TetR/AcrR family transcriptional regulator [Vibrio fluvialis]|nr:TetR/AcrR family transcriptional regulator [Vibrio fluvialis]